VRGTKLDVTDFWRAFVVGWVVIGGGLLFFAWAGGC